MITLEDTINQTDKAIACEINVADCSWGSSITPMDKWQEYEAARSSRATAGLSGDFWLWLAQTYPSAERADRNAASAKAEGHKSGYAAGLAQGKIEGAVTERARLRAVIQSPEGRANPGRAIESALASHSDASAVIKSLASGAKTHAGDDHGWGTAMQAAGIKTKSPAAPAAAGNHGWNDIVERMNAETRQANSAGDKPASSSGNRGWDEIVAKVNAEARAGR